MKRKCRSLKSIITCRTSRHFIKMTKFSVSVQVINSLHKMTPLYFNIPTSSVASGQVDRMPSLGHAQGPLLLAGGGKSRGDPAERKGLLHRLQVRLLLTGAILNCWPNLIISGSIKIPGAVVLSKNLPVATSVPVSGCPKGNLQISKFLPSWSWVWSMARSTYVNSSPPSSAYMRQWIRSALVQIMACRLFGDKPLSKPVLGYCQLDPKEETSVEL